MSIFVHNTLTGKKEEFVPLTDKKVLMYVCGVTPYDEVHLGHARVYVTFDVIHRFLELSGYQVKFVQNFTDVDDKIIKRAAEQNISPLTLTETFIHNYFEEMDKLNILRADLYPRVTENIDKIIKAIEALAHKNAAYAVYGDVYYAVKKFHGYGKLSKRNIDDLEGVARIEPSEKKKDPLDFALWKKSKPEEPAELSWNSPWGKGRPGWHIECSVMASNYLGETIDIHGGGQDLIFPHHENEIAQSEALSGKPFARYWIHNGFVTVNREKMSKSLGNFFTLKDIFKKYEPRVVRYFLLNQHYRSQLDFSDSKLEESRKALDGLDDLLQKLGGSSKNSTEPIAEIVDKIKAALSDDFNTEKAIALLHEIKNDTLSKFHKLGPDELSKIHATITLMLKDYLGIQPLEKENIPEKVLELKSDREKSRKEKNWAASDELRKQISSLGFVVEDNPDGTSILIKK
jgi:cysteinyl-tRNA synthetase